MKKTWIIALCLAAAVGLSACASAQTGPSPSPELTPAPAPAATPKPTPAPEPTPTPTPEPPAPRDRNPLTGEPMEPEQAEKRPIAIMLNNLYQALPQLGNSQADIIYEVLAEGGITRMLGVYQSVEGVGTIGSVRSARTYYLELALGLDAVYLHAGGSPDAYQKIPAWGVTALDCVNGPYEGTLFWRDAQRRKNKGFEHSVVTSGETISELLPTYGFRLEHEEGYSYPQSYTEDGTPTGGEKAEKLTVPFSSYKTGVFTYDPERKVYLAEEYGAPYIDGNTGEQVAATNVVVLRTACDLIPGDEAGRITVDLTSGGDGWYACGGKIIPIRWAKADRNSPLVYTTQAGEDLALGVGNSYVNIVPIRTEITWE